MVRRCCLLLLVLLVVGLGPLLWLAKSAVTPTQDTLRTPMALFPNGIDWANLRERLERRPGQPVLPQHGRARRRLVVVQIVVAATGGYVLSVLRPWYARLLNGLVLATLFVPAVVLLVPLYLTVLDLPLIDHSLINSYWASGCRPARARSTSCW